MWFWNWLLGYTPDDLERAKIKMARGQILTKVERRAIISEEVEDMWSKALYE